MFGKALRWRCGVCLYITVVVIIISFAYFSNVYDMFIIYLTQGRYGEFCNSEAHSPSFCSRQYGHPEYKQMVHYIGQKLGHTKMELPFLLNKITKKNLESFKFVNVTVLPKLKYQFNKPYIDKCGAKRFICLDFTERKSDVLHRGGSSFLAETYNVSALTGTMCAYEDYMNGTYSVCCDIIAPVQVINITVAFTDYQAFQGHAMAIGNTIFLKTVLVNQTLYPVSDTFSADMMFTTSWTRDNNSRWHWYKEGKRVAPTFTEHTLKYCISQVYGSQTMMIGDSHVRGIYSYLTTSLGMNYEHMSTDKHREKEWHMHRFSWAPYPNDVIKKINQFSHNLGKSRKPTLLILNTGAHTLHTKGIVPLLLDIRILIKGLANFMTQLATRTYVKVLFIDIPSTSDSYSTHYDPHHWRNQVSAAALNRAICNMLTDINIPCISYGELSSYWRNSPVCNGHFLCVDEFDVKGESGKEVMNQILHAACPHQCI